MKAPIIKVEHIVAEEGVSLIDNDISYIILMMERLIKENGFTKAPITLALNGNGLFIETIDIPRLTAQEEKKAIQIEMDRLYNDYQERFAFVQNSFLVNKQLRRIKIALYERYRYTDILHIVKRLKHNLRIVVVTPYALTQAIETHHLCDVAKPFIFVNVSAQNTIVLVYRKMLESYHVYNIGIPKQEGVDSSEYYLIKSDALKKIAKDVKKVLYNTKNNDIQSVYLNIESDIDENGLDLFSDYLSMEIIKPIEKKDVLPYLSFIGALLPVKKEVLLFRHGCRWLKRNKEKECAKMGKNKGFLLTEVIVSIAIVAIMMLAATSVFLSIRRVENHIATRENIIGEVNNIFNIFSSEPNNFIANIRSFYSDTNEKIDETIILFYNKSFVPMANGSSSIICFLTVENNIYTLELEFVNGYEQFPKEEALTRSIRVGD